jgi:hypothetical protein
MCLFVFYFSFVSLVFISLLRSVFVFHPFQAQGLFQFALISSFFLLTNFVAAKSKTGFVEVRSPFRLDAKK